MKQKAEEFYAKKTGKNISEFDDYDKFVCLVANEFHQSLEVSDEEIEKIDRFTPCYNHRDEITMDTHPEGQWVQLSDVKKCLKLR